jgi:hypothetical protein
VVGATEKRHRRQGRPFSLNLQQPTHTTSNTRPQPKGGPRLGRAGGQVVGGALAGFGAPAQEAGDEVMEEFLRGRSDLDWTIMRPSGLFDAPAVTGYEPHEDQAPGVFTSRADLAASLLEQAADTRFVRKAVAVTTSEGVPTLFEIIRREAFKKH